MKLSLILLCLLLLPTVAVAQTTIVDDSSENVISAGSWTRGTYGSGLCDGAYHVASTSSEESATFKWEATLQSGLYDVYAWFRGGSNRSSAAKYTVSDGSWTQTCYANQQTQSGTWVWLYRAQFAGNSPASVTLSNLADSGDLVHVVVADAVKFDLVTPEPSGFAFLLLGLAGLPAIRRRR